MGGCDSLPCEWTEDDRLWSHVQGKLSHTERALAAARAGLDSAAAQASELTEELTAERKRVSALTSDIKRAGGAPLAGP